MALDGLLDVLKKSGLVVEENGQHGINVQRVFQLSKKWGDQIADSIEGPTPRSSARATKAPRRKRSSAQVTISEVDDVGPSTSSAALAAINGIKEKDINVPAGSATITAIEDRKINVNPDGLQPGNVYIINTLRFHDTSLEERTGSLIDVTRLMTVLDKFHLHIESILDGTLSDVRSLMARITSHDFSKVSCLMIVIMSHGYEGNIVAAKDGTYSLDRDIMYPILRNQTLVSKLKLIVTQSCKGSVDPMQFQMDGPAPNVIPSEILQFNSCVEGYPSYRYPKTGSLFIRTLCDILEEHGLKTDILSIVNRVVADVKEKCSNIQIPMVHTNLTKQFVFGHYVPNTTKKAECNTQASSDRK